MPIFSTITDALVVRATRNNPYESRYLRDHFERRYGIRIGLYSNSYFDRWRVPPGTVAGRYSTISKTSRIISANHPIASLSTHPYFYLKEFGFVDEDLHDRRTTVIEDDVWMGHYAVVAPGCKVVGLGSIIGAGSVVSRDVPRYAIMMGSPAQLTRYRFREDVIDAIEATEWWLLDKEDLKRGLRVAKEFHTAPTVESARAFMRAIGRSDSIIASAPRTRASAQQEPARPLTPVGNSASHAAVLDLLKAEVSGFSPEELDSSFEDLGTDSFGTPCAPARELRARLSGRTDFGPGLGANLDAGGRDRPIVSADGRWTIAHTRGSGGRDRAGRDAPGDRQCDGIVLAPRPDGQGQRIAALEAGEGGAGLWQQLIELADCNLDVSQTVQNSIGCCSSTSAWAPATGMPSGQFVLQCSVRRPLDISCLRSGLAACVAGFTSPSTKVNTACTSKIWPIRSPRFTRSDPDVVLLAFDAAHLARGSTPAPMRRRRMRHCNDALALEAMLADRPASARSHSCSRRRCRCFDRCLAAMNEGCQVRRRASLAA